MTPKQRRAFAAELGRAGGKKGGLSRSPAKVAAARRNARLGGRKKKSPMSA